MGKPKLDFLFRDLTQLGLPKSQFSLIDNTILSDETTYNYNPDRYNFYMQLLDDVADPNQKIASKVFGVLARNRRQHERIREKIDGIANAIQYLKTRYTKPATIGAPREYGELATMKDDLNNNLKRIPIVSKEYEFDTDFTKMETSEIEKQKIQEKAEQLLAEDPTRLNYIRLKELETILNELDYKIKSFTPTAMAGGVGYDDTSTAQPPTTAEPPSAQVETPSTAQPPTTAVPTSVQVETPNIENNELKNQFEKEAKESKTELAYLQGQLETLKKQNDEARENINITRKKISLQTNKQELDKLRNDFNTYMETVKNLSKDIDSLESKISALNKQIYEKEVNVIDKILKLANQNAVEISRIDKDIGGILETSKKHTEDINKTNSEINGLKGQLANYKQRIEQNSEAQKLFEQNISEITEKLKTSSSAADIQQIKQSLQLQIDNLLRETKYNTLDISNIYKKFKEAATKEELQQVTTELKDAQSKVSNTVTAQLKTHIEDIQSKLAAQNKTFEDTTSKLDEQVTSFIKNLQEMISRKSQIDQQIGALQSGIATLKTDAVKIQAEITALNTQIQTSQAQPAATTSIGEGTPVSKEETINQLKTKRTQLQKTSTELQDRITKEQSALEKLQNENLQIDKSIVGLEQITVGIENEVKAENQNIDESKRGIWEKITNGFSKIAGIFSIFKRDRSAPYRDTSSADPQQTPPTLAAPSPPPQPHVATVPPPPALPPVATVPPPPAPPPTTASSATRLLLPWPTRTEQSALQGQSSSLTQVKVPVRASINSLPTPPPPTNPSASPPLPPQPSIAVEPKQTEVDNELTQNILKLLTVLETIFQNMPDNIFNEQTYGKQQLNIKNTGNIIKNEVLSVFNPTKIEDAFFSLLRKENPKTFYNRENNNRYSTIKEIYTLCQLLYEIISQKSNICGYDITKTDNYPYYKGVEDINRRLKDLKVNDVEFFYYKTAEELNSLITSQINNIVALLKVIEELQGCLTDIKPKINQLTDGIKTFQVTREGGTSDIEKEIEEEIPEEIEPIKRNPKAAPPINRKPQIPSRALPPSEYVPSVEPKVPMSILPDAFLKARGIHKEKEGGNPDFVDMVKYMAQQQGGSWFGDKAKEFDEIDTKTKMKILRDRKEVDAAEDDILLEYKNHPLYSPDNQEVTYTDRLVFVAITFVFRAISLFMVEWGINTKLIKSFNGCVVVYVVMYLLLFSIWVLLVNIRKNNLFFGMLFYYINSNYNTAVRKRIIIHMSIQLIMLVTPFAVVDPSVVGPTEIDTFDKKERVMNTIGMFTFIIWFLTSFVALRA